MDPAYNPYDPERPMGALNVTAHDLRMLVIALTDLRARRKKDSLDGVHIAGLLAAVHKLDSWEAMADRARGKFVNASTL